MCESSDSDSDSGSGVDVGCEESFCSSRGTLRVIKEDNTCACNSAFSGILCDRCQDPVLEYDDGDGDGGGGGDGDGHRKKRISCLCCKINLFGLDWGLLCPKDDYLLQNFLNGSYENAKDCIVRPTSTGHDNDSSLDCYCQMTTNNEENNNTTTTNESKSIQNAVDPVWLADLLSSGNQYKLPRISHSVGVGTSRHTDFLNSSPSSSDNGDNVQAVVLLILSIGVGFCLLCLCCYCCLIFFISPSVNGGRRKKESLY